MHLETSGIVVAVLPHGEHGAIVRLLTPVDGLRAGYVRGGRSRRLRPVLGVGNSVTAELRARIDEQLPALTVELARSRAPLAAEPLAAAALEWVGALVATTLPEAQPHAALHDGLERLLTNMEREPVVNWVAALARFELLVLAELGFGLDLNRCAATGVATDLAHVSPRSSTAVSRASGLPYAARLLPLPPLLLGGDVGPGDLAAALLTTGFFLRRDLLTGPAARVVLARDRVAALVDKLGRASAVAV